MEISIVTVHLNDFKGLERTLKSLDPMIAYDGIEWIVIDGGSDLERDHKDILSQVRLLSDHLVSESDNGIYDAMNKGTKLASGDYVLYLNAGDELHSNFRYDEYKKAVFNSTPAMVWGRADVRDRSETVYSRKTRNPRWLLYGTAVCHQAVFFRRLVLGLNPYDTGLSIAADYDLICRLYKRGEKIQKLDMHVCVFDLIGKSSTDKRLTIREESTVRIKHFSIPRFFNGLITELKYIIWQIGTLIPSFRRGWSRIF